MLNEQYRECIEACVACAIACRQCASACLQEEEVKMLTSCIRTDLECAAICDAAAQVMSLEGAFTEQICQLCAAACERCAEECEKHAQHGMEHCRICAVECRRCMNACIQMTSI